MLGQSEEDIDLEIKKFELQKLQERFTFLEKVKKFLKHYYTSATDPSKCQFHYTTAEVHEQLCALFPSPAMTMEEVAIMLNEGGYCFYDFGKMKFEWLFNKM